MKPALLLLLLFATAALGAPEAPPVDPSDDFSPMLLGFFVIGVCIVLFLFAVSIIIGIIAAVSTVVLIALGIVSSSAFIGLFCRRFSSGLRALHYQLCAVSALPLGVGTLWLGSYLFSIDLPPRYIFMIGSAAGLCGGLLVAFAFDRLAGIAYRHFVTRALPSATVSASS
jgi:hypothetical protein